MTAEEKHFNKMELEAYKDYNSVNRSLVPGIQNEKPRFGNAQISDVGTTKPVKAANVAYSQNIDRLKKYGASNLGRDIG